MFLWLLVYSVAFLYKFESTEVTKSIFKNLSKKQLRLNDKLADHINQLTDALNEVKRTIEAETYGVDPNIPLVTLELVLSIKVEIQACVMEKGISTYNNVVHEFETLSMDFSKLTLEEVYAMQQLH